MPRYWLAGIPNGKIPLRDWLGRWMDEVVAPNRRQGTKERYRDIIDRVRDSRCV